jgi:hypothetical protein
MPIVTTLHTILRDPGTMATWGVPLSGTPVVTTYIL